MPQANWEYRGNFGEVTMPALHPEKVQEPKICTAESFGLSATGPDHSENQDRFLTATFGRWAHVDETNITTDVGQLRDVLTVGQGQLMMVADGMGGHAHGGLASQVVIDSLYSYLVTRTTWPAQPVLSADEALQDLRLALEHAQRRLAWVALRKNVGSSHVGTTAVVGMIAWPMLLLAHAGDSRCYLYRQGTLQRLTTDHTVGQEGRDLGDTDDSTRPFDHILTSAILNSGQPPHIGLSKIALTEGDLILMCTDGVSACLDEAVMAETICHESTARGVCESLLTAALNRTTDDATVVATKIVRA